jgi:hypothetical protein
MAFNFQIPTISFRLKIIILSIIILIGALLLIFTSFFNFGTLQISGSAPFSLIIDNGKAAACPESPCSIKLAPGQYSAVFQKNEFLDQTQEFSINLNQITSVDLQFQAVPKVNLSGVWNPANLQFPDADSINRLNLENNLNSINLNTSAAKWNSLAQIIRSQPTVIAFQISPDLNYLILDNGQNVLLYSLDKPDQPAVLPIRSKRYFSFSSNSEAIYHLTLDPQTFRPGIFKETVSTITFPESKPSTGPRVRSATPAQLPIPNPSAPALITLVQDFPQAKLIPSPDQQKIALLDLQQNALYLFDFQNKTRQKLTEQPNLKSLLWLNEESFLLESRPDQQPNPDLWHGQLTPSSTANSNLNLQKLPLNLNLAGLDLIYPIDSNRLLIAETSNSNSTQLNPLGFQFSTFDLQTQQKTFLHAVNNLPLPRRFFYQDGQIYFLTSENIYTLNLSF